MSQYDEIINLENQKGKNQDTSPTKYSTMKYEMGAKLDLTNIEEYNKPKTLKKMT